MNGLYQPTKKPQAERKTERNQHLVRMKSIKSSYVSNRKACQSIMNSPTKTIIPNVNSSSSPQGSEQTQLYVRDAHHGN